MQTGSVDEDDLMSRITVNAEDTMTGGLRFAGSDTDFLAKQMIEQCRFANIWAPYQSHEATMLLFASNDRLRAH